MTDGLLLTSLVSSGMASALQAVVEIQYRLPRGVVLNVLVLNLVFNFSSQPLCSEPDCVTCHHLEFLG